MIPPVPDLPPSLNVTLPFEPSTSTIATHSSLSSDGKGEFVVVPRNASVKTPTTTTTPSKSSASPMPTPTPAAAVVHQYAAKEQKLKDSGVIRAQTLADARLTVTQVTEVIQLAGSEIKQRGLANVGILRPFRVGTTLATVQRLAELYLLTADPEKYGNTLSISGQEPAATSDIAIATFGKPSARKELNKQLAYANVHSVGDLLRWALRRLKVSPATDFNSTAENPLAWYDAFRDAEQRAGYDKKAFSNLLLPSLPATTGTLLTELLELLTTVSAHYVANAMPASRAAKSFGYWLVGRIGVDRPAQNLDAFLKEWHRSSSVMEHLLLAYLRDQSTRLHYMPTRLAELIEGYPHIPIDSEFQSPGIRSASTLTHSISTNATALRVSLRGDNIDLATSKTRGPHDILASALEAHLPDAESSTEADDWMSLATLAKAAVKQLQVAAGDADDSGEGKPQPGASEHHAAKQASLLRDEDLRLLSIFASEFDAHKKLLGVKDAESAKMHDVQSSPSASASRLPLLSPAAASSSSIYKEFMSRSAGIGGTSTTMPPRSKRLSTLAEDAASSSGAGAGASGRASPRLSVNSSGKPTSSNGAHPASNGLGSLSSLAFDTGRGDIDLTLGSAIPTSETAAKPANTRNSTESEAAKADPPSTSLASKIRRQSSLGALRQRVRSSKRWDESGARGDAAASAEPSTIPMRPTFAVTKVTSLPTFDDSVVSLWQDAVLDFSGSIALPAVVFLQLNKEASAKLMSSAGGAHGGSEEATAVTAAAGTLNGSSRSGMGRFATKAPGAAGSGGAWLIIEEELRMADTSSKAGGGGASGRGASGTTTRLRGSSHDAFDGSGGDATSMEGKRSLFSPSLRSLGASIRRRASLKRMASFGGGLRKRADSQATASPKGVGKSAGDGDATTPRVRATDLPSAPAAAGVRIPPKSPSRPPFKALVAEEANREAGGDDAPPRMSSAASSRYADAEAGEDS